MIVGDQDRNLYFSQGHLTTFFCIWQFIKASSAGLFTRDPGMSGARG
jgi:hypothetical protein